MSISVKEPSTIKPVLPRESGAQTLMSFLAVIVSYIAAFSDLHIWLEAKIDKQAGTLMDENAFTPFVWELHEEFNNRTAKAVKRSENIATYLRAKINTLSDALSKWNTQLNHKLKPDYETAEKEMKKLEDDCHQHSHRNLIIYFAMLTMLATLDFPTQIAAFEAEGNAGWLTWAICIVIAALTGLLAHFVGVTSNQKGRLWRALTLLIPLMATVLFALIAFIRLASFERLNLAEIGVTLSPRVTAVVYFLVNIGIFTTASVYSILVHKTEDLECRRAKRSAAKRFSSASAQYEDVIKRISSKESLLNDFFAKEEGLPRLLEGEKNSLQAIFHTKYQVYRKTYLRSGHY